MASTLPDYVAAAKPIPQQDRAPWYANTAPTYAGIMLWFVFWHEVPLGSVLQAGKPYSQFAGGTLAEGLGVAFLGLVVAALICHFLFYLVPGMLGMKTGLPLYIVGTSTYGVQGGFLMPGFLMGVLQYGWVAVNSFFAATLLCAPFGHGPGTVVFSIVAAIWAIAAAFLGLKGIQYVAKVATFLPLIPLVILLYLFFQTMGGISSFDPDSLVEAGAAVEVVAEGTEEAAGAPLKAQAPLTLLGIIALLSTYIVGFFATAGAAGADFGMNNRNANDVRMGGLVGIAGATIFAGGLALLIVAGAHGGGMASDGGALQATALMTDIVGENQAAILWYLLAIAAFPPACFSSFIAANSFKTTLPNVNPYISCGIGTLVAIVLAVTGMAGNAVGVFTIIGASFGPVCGAMAADYLLSGRQWAGPRAGFNMAGWISWLIGFAVGAADFIPGMAGKVPCPPVAAFLVGFVLYLVLSKVGMESRKVEMPGTEAA